MPWLVWSLYCCQEENAAIQYNMAQILIIIYPCSLGCSTTFTLCFICNKSKMLFNGNIHTYIHIYTHKYATQKQLEIILTKMFWLLGHKTKFFTSNKLLIYKTILKSIWTYRIQLWDMDSNPNIEIESLAHDRWLSEWISKYQQLKKKSTTTALNTVLASVHTQMT
jgi:hypothetical protein